MLFLVDSDDYDLNEIGFDCVGFVDYYFVDDEIEVVENEIVVVEIDENNLV